ncbi:MAG: hypothetical protein ATN35_05815 [Epulopiscium sp. Nele67-Bin004]|nr:MAG: hypothetical protein ATN35_05815 [Epulopiscium sp. Nele67-Bin004]
MITVAQVTQASEIELLCITYELFLESVQDAIDEPDQKLSKNHRARAKKILRILFSNLNLEDKLAHDLFDIYIYVQKCLNEKDGLAEAHKLISNIKRGYDEVRNTQPIKKSAAMENTQSIYAGMTYSGNQLGEMIVENNNRGFTV